ncbi:uncharacterized protein LOC135844469 [Planococcus citri]|uniref:uncharacterized protein LOC135844469 n=1 Tax=Planococcus citri TaxID=170843 RepID=UPI0031F89020
MNVACVIGAMKLDKFIIIFIANLRCFVVTGAKTKEFVQSELDQQGMQQYQYLNEKKIQFTKTTGQYIKFGVNLQGLLDFAMCLWYKPITILDQNILFSYGNQKEQLILWKIKKKQNTPVVIFKIFNTLISEEKAPKLLTGQWHHICQYWQGSTGLWALFLNTYIVSFGYTNISNTNWYIPASNSTATINHPRTKDTLHGEIHGFYFTSLNSTTSPPNVNASPSSKIMSKRQADTIPVDAEPRALFFVGKLFTFVRRMVSFVAVPVFRFMRGLISPWRKSLTASRSTMTEKTPPFTKLPPSSATEIITDLRTLPETTTPKKGVVQVVHISKLSKANDTLKLEKTSYSSGKAPQQYHADLANLEESLTIYETEPDNESRYMRNVVLNHSANPQPPPVHSMESLNIQPQESNKFQTYFNDVIDKCLMLELTFKKQQLQKERLNGLDSAEVTVDAITRLDTSLQFMQFLYACCFVQNDAILISWDRSRSLVSNVVVQNISGCGNF